MNKLVGFHLNQMRNECMRLCPEKIWKEKKAKAEKKLRDNNMVLTLWCGDHNKSEKQKYWAKLGLGGALTGRCGTHRQD